jgi:hypothetical protein
MSALKVWLTATEDYLPGLSLPLQFSVEIPVETQ